MVVPIGAMDVNCRRYARSRSRQVTAARPFAQYVASACAGHIQMRATGWNRGRTPADPANAREVELAPTWSRYSDGALQGRRVPKRVQVMQTDIAVVLVVVVVLALLAVAIVFLRKRRADKLRLRFGPEYERTVGAAGGRGKAEAQLHQRQKRVQGFSIKPLTSEQREQYAPAWKDIQAKFVDDPKLALVGADQLLGEVMVRRGYPVGDFEQRSADLSVDHPVVVQNYRTAHDIVVRDGQGEASTEDLRQAMLCYRALFRELVDEPVAGDPIVDAGAQDQAPVAAASEIEKLAPVGRPVVLETAPPEEIVTDEPALSAQLVTDKGAIDAPAAAT